MSFPMTPEDEELLVEMLAAIYNAVPWGKMRTSKNPHDVFNHRVRAASRRGTLYQAVSALANYFGLQSIPAAAVRLVEELRPVEREVLNRLYREHVMFSMLGILRARELREARRTARPARLDADVERNAREDQRDEDPDR